jgi:hypothetical protein
MRKRIIRSDPATPSSVTGDLDVAVLASVEVSSESAEHPVENAFDQRRGPGGSRWVAQTLGDQTLILAAISAPTFKLVFLEWEERG